VTEAAEPHDARAESPLVRRYRSVFAYAGLIWVIAGGILLTPLLALPAFPAEAGLWWAFVLPALGLAGVGGLAWRLRRNEPAPVLTLTEGAGIVVLAWLGAILAGTAVFMLSIDLTFTQAVFEATSGWTTTGLSVVDVTKAPKVVLLLRSVLELAGGAGLAILMISVMRGPAGPGLSTAEGRAEQLVPNVVRSAKLVVTLYTIYNVVGCVALWLAGMSWFDAVNHAFAALSTGGFSTRPESIGYWDSPAVEAVTIVLMLFGTTSFVTAYAVFRGRWVEGTRSGELRFLGALAALATLVLLIWVVLPLDGQFGRGVRVAVFNTVSAISTTGFSTVDFAPWNGLGFVVLVVLMLIGGGAGSTAGGMKLARVYLLARVVLWETQRVFLPRTAVNRPYLWQGGERAAIRDEDVRRVAAFLFLYMVAFAAGAGVMAAHGASVQDALFEMASTLGTVGLSVGVTRADAPAAVLWTQVVGMLLGRLEFFALIVGVQRLLVDGAAALTSWRPHPRPVPDERPALQDVQQ